MGYEIRRQVRAALPAGLLTAAERLLLLEIADLARDDTRKGWPGVEALAEATDLSIDSIPRLLGRIAAKWMDIRVQVGTDTKDRPVYARNGHRTVFHFPETLDHGQTLMLDDGPTSREQGWTGEAVPSDGGPTLQPERLDPHSAKVGPRSTPLPQYSSKNNLKSSSSPSSKNDEEDDDRASTSKTQQPKLSRRDREERQARQIIAEHTTATPEQVTALLADLAARGKKSAGAYLAAVVREDGEDRIADLVEDAWLDRATQPARASPNGNGKYQPYRNRTDPDAYHGDL